MFVRREERLNWLKIWRDFSIAINYADRMIKLQYYGVDIMTYGWKLLIRSRVDLIEHHVEEFLLMTGRMSYYMEQLPSTQGPTAYQQFLEEFHG